MGIGIRILVLGLNILSPASLGSEIVNSEGRISGSTMY